jgi:hypothetical protein
MSDTMINTSKKQSYQVPYEVLEKRLEAIPVEFLSDVSDFFDLLDYKINVIKSQKKDKLSTEAGMDLLKQITGCVSSDITIGDAKSEYFSEKYGS